MVNYFSHLPRYPFCFNTFPAQDISCNFGIIAVSVAKLQQVQQAPFGGALACSRPQRSTRPPPAEGVNKFRRRGKDCSGLAKFPSPHGHPGEMPAVSFVLATRRPRAATGQPGRWPPDTNRASLGSSSARERKSV